jgi:EAL domain-containing protein (putative c-di-GMP-specific phosphodiesterase class I)
MYANLAMYSVKKSEQSEVAFYNKLMQTDKIRFNYIKEELKDAIVNGGFILLYQPIMDITKKKVKSYEALVRFKNHNIYPDEFIPIAETTGLILPIGRYVIESAIKQIAQWELENRMCTNVSVNFSTKQFYDEGIIDFIKEKLNQYSVPSECLTIEITETFLHEKSIEEVRNFLVELKKMNLKIAMDDFGTGFTSVMFFNHFPFDVIKLDKSFVEDKLKKSKTKVFETWLLLFQAYNYIVIAEGVETVNQLKQLEKLGVDYVQGYYFSRPLSVEAIENLGFSKGGF